MTQIPAKQYYMLHNIDSMIYESHTYIFVGAPYNFIAARVNVQFGGYRARDMKFRLWHANEPAQSTVVKQTGKMSKLFDITITKEWADKCVELLSSGLEQEAIYPKLHSITPECLQPPIIYNSD